jgi:hypothetical protein
MLTMCPGLPAYSFARPFGHTPLLPSAQGKYGADPACINCPAGRFFVAVGARQESDCGNCPLGTYSANPGASLLTACIGCPTGKRGKTGGKSSIADGCEACELLSYQDVVGQASCKADVCGAGTYAASTNPTGATTKSGCANCPAGTYSSLSGLSKETDCSACPTGKYSVNAGQTSVVACTSCAIGRKGTTDGQSSEDAGCEYCVPGTSYQDQSGQVSCKASVCGKGQYAEGTATDTSPSKATTCANCPSGRFSGVSGLKNAGECNKCPTGRFGASSGLERVDQCTMCPVGKRGKTAGQASFATGCEDCEVGRGYQDFPGQVSCKPDVCPEGSYASSTSTDARVKTQCAPCPTGRYSGVTGLTDEDGCNKCAIGRYTSQTGQTAAAGCSLCPAGRRGTADGQASVAAGCELCKAGYSFQDEEGQVSCKIATCAAGKYATAGDYNYLYASSPTTNTTNTTTSSNISASVSSNSSTGSGGGINGTGNGGIADVTRPADCSPCPGGKYSSKAGLGSIDECDFCPAGRWGMMKGASTLDQCQVCKGGTFSNTSGDTTARCSGLCPPGKYSDDG